ncbi:MAG: DNA mismatch repair endonuclease MutL [Bacteroidales bacterium]|nr:DNA mismatch repair endonuclease MutL [Bacteroidales bacterium]
MEDIIRLLPDAVANQIAAGEVVQRPASVVKELLENAVDAGATQIQLIIKDAGKTLIQVTDNGKGMSFNDARLCFERHATSKLRKADDLFHICTKGFRGEALASIAAIAHVELKTKPAADEMGTLVLIEGADIKEHAPVTCADGTSIAVKNLFFNVPARRNFLKSDKVELTHIEEEFYRVALIHHDLTFQYYNDGKLVLLLPASNMRQRIVNVFGQHFNDKLFPVELNHELMRVTGFIAKPENAKRKSEQYMFVNHRYVRHSLLNFAVEKAYADLIPQGSHPAYFIALDIDPAMIDVNVSPTKVEVKLQDERLFFGFLNSTVKKALGTMSLTPMIDFDDSFPDIITDRPENKEIVAPTIRTNPNYNPFDKVPEKKHNSPFQQFGGGNFRRETPSSNDWENFLKELNVEKVEYPKEEQQQVEFQSHTGENQLDIPENIPFFVFGGRYLFFELNGQVMAADLPNVQERILYDMYVNALKNTPIRPQQSLFPQTVTLTAAQTDLAISLKEDFLRLGYDLEKIDNTHLAVNATPNDEEEEGDVQALIENVLTAYQTNQVIHKGDKIAGIAQSLARQKRSRQRVPDTQEEVKALIRRLFESDMPTLTPSGKSTLHIFGAEELRHYFE